VISMPPSPPRRRLNLAPFLFGSLLVHGTLATFVRLAPMQADPPEPEDFAEITLLPQPEELQPLEPEPVAAAVAGDGWATDLPGERGVQGQASYVPADVPAILGRAQAIRRGAAADAAEVDIELPVSSPPEPGLDLSAYKLPLVPSTPAPQEAAPAAQPLDGGLSVMKEVSSGRPDRPSLERPVDFRRFESALRSARGAAADGGVRGPAAARLILEQPPVPKMEVTEDSLLRFRFWVLPDGRVSEVVPLQKGNAELERLASDYLRRWRFNATPPGGSKVWGEITIKFRPS
jgi:TonB family protein